MQVTERGMSADVSETQINVPLPYNKKNATPAGKYQGIPMSCTKRAGMNLLKICCTRDIRKIKR
ncbi:hypothetical protein [Methanosarcina horonobensis]|nr:hypothetical protein [Methanosarcina horonobensis]